VIVYHVAVTTADDYVARREPHRRAHIERLTGLRAAGAVIGGGPAPDGRSADVVYRLRQAEALRRVVEDDPYWTGGAWTRYTPRSFVTFVEPWEAVPAVLDGSRPVVIVEGRAAEHDAAQLTLIELRGAGRLAFGGSFEGGDTLMLLKTADADEALGWLRETDIWAPDSLRARPLLWVL
jgi:uncharacterized protein YciI